MPATAPFGAMLPQAAHVRRARNVELNDGAVLIAHKAVIHICLVNVVSCDLPIRIDCPREGTLVERAGTGVRSIEYGNRAILIQQETVIQTSASMRTPMMVPFGVKPPPYVPWPGPVPAPGRSNVVMTPFLSRRKPWTALVPSK